MKKPGNNHNDLLPWFTEDHGTLPEAYKKSCEKFFYKLQAPSGKRQAERAKVSTLLNAILPDRKV